ncbi:MAG: Plug domain-containing protein, partial [Daejeonella sp.]
MTKIKFLVLILLFNYSVKAQDSIKLINPATSSKDKVLEKEISSLSSYLETSVTISTKTPLDVREAPSVVSVITSDEIKKIGARDLMDVLNLMPGLN